MRRIVLAGAIIVMALGVLACGGAGRHALTRSDGGPIEVFYFVDYGIKDTTPGDKAEQLKQVGSFLDKQVQRHLTAVGFKSIGLDDPNVFVPEAERYLVMVTISAYNAGSKAARYFVGGGVGAASLAIHYALFADGKAPIYEDDFVSSGGTSWANAGDWTACAADVAKAVRKFSLRDIEADLGR